MSIQAWMVLGVYVLLLIISFITAIVKKAFNASFLVGFIFSIGFVALMTYDTACLTHGTCDVWSWIRSVLWIIFPVIFLIFYLFSLGQKSTTETVEKTNTVVTTPVTVTTTTTAAK